MKNIKSLSENCYTIHFFDGKKINITKETAIKVMKQKADQTKFIVLDIDGLPYAFASSAISMIIPREYSKYEKIDLMEAGLDFPRNKMLGI